MLKYEYIYIYIYIYTIYITKHDATCDITRHSILLHVAVKVETWQVALEAPFTGGTSCITLKKFKKICTNMNRI